jgi:hypothetical protein
VSATVFYTSMSLDGFVAGPNEEPGKGSRGRWRSVIKALLDLRILVWSFFVKDRQIDVSVWTSPRALPN